MNPTNDAEQIIALAIKWWSIHKPVDWTLAQHLGNPTVNLPTPAEQALAIAIAKYHQWRK